MRTTINIDDDILAAARQLAGRDLKSVGEVVSALARQSLESAENPPLFRNGIPLLDAIWRNKSVTPELVKELLGELP